MRGAAQRTDDILRNGFAVPALDRAELLLVFPFIVLEEELPVLFIKRLDGRKPVRLKLLVFRGVSIIMSPLFKRDKFAEQKDEGAVHLIKVIDNFDKIKYNSHEQCLLCVMLCLAILLYTK